jgi:subtilisin family serine protease
MSQANHSFFESLEDRQLLAGAPWGTQARLIGQDLAVQRFPQINGSGYAVAVIDSGVDYNHPSLGSGFGKKIVGGWDFEKNDSDPMSDSYAHGTGVAGMVGADPYDYKGYHYQGIAPGAKILALKQRGSSGVANALKWVVANKTRYNIVAVNVTDYAGGGTTDIWKSINSSIDTLDSMGVYVVQPSGNAGSKTFSTSDPDQVEVGSVTLSDGISGFTNRGPGLDFLAPGDNVTLPYYDVGSKRHIYVDTADGTSWAAPQIAGAAALIRQVNSGFSNGQITSILKDSAVWKFDSATGRSYPRLNLYNALLTAYQRAGKTPPPAPSGTTTPQPPAGVAVTVPTNIGTNTTIQAEDFDSGASGTAFWDSTSANQGGNNYRSTAVDVISLNDSGSTRGVGFTKAGEWLKYTVNVQSAGTYNVELRVAAMGTGGQLRLEVDGKDVTGAMNVPDTKSWTTFQTMTKTGVNLAAGKHTLRLFFARNGSSGFVANVNYLKFVKPTTTTTQPPATTPATIVPSVPTTLQVEDFDNGTRGGTWWDTDTTNQGGNN